MILYISDFQDRQGMAISFQTYIKSITGSLLSRRLIHCLLNPEKFLPGKSQNLSWFKLTKIKYQVMQAAPFLMAT